MTDDNSPTLDDKIAATSVTDREMETDPGFHERMLSATGLSDTEDRAFGYPVREYAPQQVRRVALAEVPPFSPTEVADAHQIAARSAERVNEIADRVEGLPGEIAAELAAYRRAVAEADAAGRTLPKHKPRDLEGELIPLQAQYAARRKVFDEAAADYDRALRASLPARAESMTAQIALARAEAVAALAPDSTATVHEAVAAVMRWRNSVPVATEAHRAAGRHVDTVRRRPDTPKPELLAQGLQEALAALGSDDPALTGEFLDWPEEQIDRYTRRRWFESGGQALLLLARLEASENYEGATAFTKGLGLFGDVPSQRRLAHRPSPAVQ